METSVSAAEANRRFSELLRNVRGGRSVVVTSHGKPVARLVPFDSPDPAANQARTDLLTRLRKQRPTRIGSWTRNDLYDE